MKRSKFVWLFIYEFWNLNVNFQVISFRSQKKSFRRQLYCWQSIGSCRFKLFDVTASGMRFFYENYPIFQIILTEIANPVDVEEALSSRVVARTEIHAISSSPQRIRDLTEKDVDVLTLPRIKLFENDSNVKNVVASGDNDKIEGHIKDLVDSYEKYFTIVERKYENLSSGESWMKMTNTRNQLAENLPRQIFEFDVEQDLNGKIPLRSVSQVGEHVS